MNRLETRHVEWLAKALYDRRCALNRRSAEMPRWDTLPITTQAPWLATAQVYLVDVVERVIDDMI